MTNTDSVIKKSFKQRLSGNRDFVSSILPQTDTQQALVLLGMTSLAVLFGLGREFLNVFGGSEFILGGVLFAWFLLSAAGIWLGGMRFTRFIRQDPMAIGFMILCLIPVISLLILHFGIEFLGSFPAGKEFWPLIGLALVVMAPVAVLIGVLFSHFTASLSEQHNKNMTLPSLSWLGLGVMAGSLLFLVLHFTVLGSIQQILIVSFFNLAFGWTLAFRAKNIMLNTIAFFINITLISLLIAFELREDFFRLHRPDAGQVRDQQESFYGQLSVADSGGKITLYTGSANYANPGTEQSIEESVHYTMLQHFNPQSVLLVNSPGPEYIDEILHYKPRRLDILETDPAVLPWLEPYKLKRSGPGINYISHDPIDYLLHTEARYDVVMLLLPDPTSLEINRYYTLEFFKLLKKRLSDTAFVYARLSKASSGSTEMNSIVFYTMKKVFRHAVLIPGEHSHFLASGNMLSIKLGAKAEKKGIVLRYINTSPEDTLVKTRIEAAMKQLTVNIKLNRDYHPSAYFTLVAATMPSADILSITMMALLSLLTAFYLFKGKSKRIAVFVTGFTLLSVMILLLMSYQAMFGNLYFMLGLLIGMIPAGIGLGVVIYRIRAKDENAPSVAALQVAIGSFSVLVLFFLLGIREITSYMPLISILFLLLSLAGGTIAGMQLSAVIEKHKEESDKVPGALHLALLLGMALGAIAGIGLLFPLIGLILGCIILGLINAALGFLFY